MVFESTRLFTAHNTLPGRPPRAAPPGLLRPEERGAAVGLEVSDGQRLLRAALAQQDHGGNGNTWHRGGSGRWQVGADGAGRSGARCWEIEV